MIAYLKKKLSQVVGSSLPSIYLEIEKLVLDLKPYVFQTLSQILLYLDSALYANPEYDRLWVNRALEIMSHHGLILFIRNQLKEPIIIIDIDLSNKFISFITNYSLNTKGIITYSDIHRIVIESNHYSSKIVDKVFFATSL